MSDENIAAMLARIAALEEAAKDEVRPHYRHRPKGRDAAMVVRTIRVPESLWADALKRADERGESLSEAIRKFLERYSR